MRHAAAATRLLDAETKIGRYVLGEGIAVAETAESLRRIGAQRAILVSEPGAWAAAGSAIADGLAAEGWPVERVLLPQGEDAKRLAVVEDAARELARLRVERSEPIVAIGGGALGDAAGFLAATYLRGIPIVHVPTTLVAQIDSSIGGKTGVDLPEGKNLVGAFHQPAAVVIDVALLSTLPERERRAALGEAAKMAVLGDERLFALLEADGEAIARGDPDAVEAGASRSSSSEPGGRRSRSCRLTSANGATRAAGSRSTWGIRSGMRSRRRPAIATCSTVRRWRMGCAPRAQSVRRLV